VPGCLQSILDKLRKNRSNFETIFDLRDGEESQYMLQKVSHQRQNENSVAQLRFQSALLDYQDDLERRHHELARDRTKLVTNADFPILPYDIGFVKNTTINEEAERASLRRLVAKRTKALLTTQILRNQAEEKLRNFEMFFNSRNSPSGRSTLIKSKLLERLKSPKSQTLTLELTEDEVATDAHPNGIHRYLEVEHPNIKMNYSQYLDELTSFEPTPISYNDMVGYRKVQISFFLEYFPLNLESKEPKKGAKAENADCRRPNKRICGHAGAGGEGSLQKDWRGDTWNRRPPQQLGVAWEHSCFDSSKTEGTDSKRNVRAPSAERRLPEGQHPVSLSGHQRGRHPPIPIFGTRGHR
jgi:hypothetical protein